VSVVDVILAQALVEAMACETPDERRARLHALASTMEDAAVAVRLLAGEKGGR